MPSSQIYHTLMPDPSGREVTRRGLDADISPGSMPQRALNIVQLFIGILCAQHMALQMQP